MRFGSTLWPDHDYTAGGLCCAEGVLLVIHWLPNGIYVIDEYQSILTSKTASTWLNPNPNEPSRLEALDAQKAVNKLVVYNCNFRLQEHQPCEPITVQNSALATGVARTWKYYNFYSKVCKQLLNTGTAQATYLPITCNSKPALRSSRQKPNMSLHKWKEGLFNQHEMIETKCWHKVFWFQFVTSGKTHLHTVASLTLSNTM